MPQIERSTGICCVRLVSSIKITVRWGKPTCFRRVRAGPWNGLWRNWWGGCCRSNRKSIHWVCFPCTTSCWWLQNLFCQIFCYSCQLPSVICIAVPCNCTDTLRKILFLVFEKTGYLSSPAGLALGLRRRLETFYFLQMTRWEVKGVVTDRIWVRPTSCRRRWRDGVSSWCPGCVEGIRWWIGMNPPQGMAFICSGGGCGHRCLVLPSLFGPQTSAALSVAWTLYVLWRHNYVTPFCEFVSPPTMAYS